MRRKKDPEVNRKRRKRVNIVKMIGTNSRLEWQNPLDPEAVDQVLRKTEYKNGLYNGYVGAMRLALSLMVRMMADDDPVIAQTAALNLMRSDGYAGLIGLPAIKTALRSVQSSMKKIAAKGKEETKEPGVVPGREEENENRPVDPLTAELLAQLEGREEDATGSD